MIPAGTPFHGALDTADCTTAVLVPIYDVDGNVISSIEADERLVITQACVVSKAANDDLTLFQDYDNDGNVDAGEQIIMLDAGANGGQQYLGARRYLRKGQIRIKVKAASAGDVKVILNGEIVR